MAEIVTENRVFFLGCLFFLTAVGLLLIATETGDAIIWFSDRRSWWLDVLFKNGTRLGEEFTYLILFIYCLFIRFRYSILVFLTGLTVSVVSYLTKTLFQQPRPSLYFEKIKLLDQIQLVEGVPLYSGYTSFPSGHTMSAFALFGLFAMLLRRKEVAGLFFLLLAIVVALSRVYLVQHFLKDIFLGAILGLVVALFLYQLHRWWPLEGDQWYNRALTGRKEQTLAMRLFP